MAKRMKSKTSRSQEATLLRLARLHIRLVFSVGLGIAVALAALAIDWRIPTRLLAGWDAGVLLYLTLIYSVVRRGDIARLRKRATEEDESAIALLLLTFFAAIASLGAIIAVLGNGDEDATPLVLLRVGFAMGTIILSWVFVHTSFALHYAHEFYGEGRDRKIGGLNFPGGGNPDYWDFLYFSLIIAMTSQVSDVTISSRSIRRVAVMHGVLSFFLNLGVLALTVSMIANLI